ncbi:MAG: CRTAC1 family protein [Proteobacteria bacterium]|nr:CRTAC1 family protein [Pseudomonadota bacterium]
MKLSAAAFVFALALSACPTEEPPPPPVDLPDGFEAGEEILCADPVDGIDRFTEEGLERGITAELSPSPGPLGSPAGAPVAADDIDGDGDLDLVFNRTVGAPYTYLNDGTGHFTEIDSNWEAQGQGGSILMNQVLADLNGDHLPDLVLVGPGAFAVSFNLGEGLFEPPTYFAVADEIMSTMALGDLDGDGDLDMSLPGIQVAGNGGGGGPPAGTPDRIYLNEGGALDWTMAYEIVPYDVGGFSISTVITDRDNDGDQDVFVPYDRVGNPGAPPNAFYRNDGNDADGVPILVNDAEETGTALFMSGMGIAGTDLNEDGFMDYCMSNTGSQICLLSSDDLFIEVSASYGLRPEGLDTSSDWSGWSLELLDLDGDGWRDMPMAGGPPLGSSGGWLEGQGDALFHGVPGGGFEEVTSLVGWDVPRTHFGLAVGDFEGDGYLDVVISGNTGPPQYWSNPCGSGAWTEVELVGVGENTGGFGARLTVEAGGRRHMDELWNLRSLGQSPSRFHVGLGDVDVIDRMELIWPDGTVMEATDVPVRRKITITR